MAIGIIVSGIVAEPVLKLVIELKEVQKTDLVKK